MKHMKVKFTECLIKKHFFMVAVGHTLVLLTFLASISTYATEPSNMGNDKMLKMLNPYAVINTRAPSNYVPEEELLVTPYDNDELWINELLVEDNAGVLKNIKNVITSWDKTESYVSNWDVESSGLYVIETRERKKSYLEKNILKYIDKRISGEVKNAEKGSTFHKVGVVQKALKPTTKVAVSKNIKIKVKASVLQGKGILLVDNPYVDYKTVFHLDGQTDMYASKSFGEVGVTTALDYNLTGESWVARVDKKIVSNVTGRLSSAQADKEMAFTEVSDKRLEFFYSYSF